MNRSFNVSKNRQFLMHSARHSSSASLIQRLVPQKRTFYCRFVAKFFLEDYHSKKLTQFSHQKRMYSSQVLVRKPAGISKKGGSTTIWNPTENIPPYAAQESDIALEDISESFHDLAYISSLYYPGDAYVTQQNLDNPKNLIWGTFVNQKSTRYISYDKNGLTYHRCILYLTNFSIIAIGDSFTKSESEQMASLSAYFQLVRRGILSVPSYAGKLERRLPAFVKSRAPSITDPESSIRLADQSEVTYERARAFMEFYCNRFRLGKLDISFESIDNKRRNGWRSILTVTGRRLGIGTGSNKKTAQIAAYFDVIQYLNGCDTDLWPAFLKAEKDGLDLGLAPKIFFSLSRTLHNDLDALCRDIRGSTLYRNVPSIDDETSLHQRAHVRQRKPLRPTGYYDAKSEVLKNRLTAYRTDLSFASLRAQRESLPVTKQGQSILSQIAVNDVIVCMAATGSGKTTQIPQLILDEAIERGDGARCNIICTQPRRIAALSVAHRVASERGETLGSRSSIGYQARFDSKPPDDNGSITFCTTGVLLKRLQNYFASSEKDDFRNLDNVTHIVVDEVHERDVDTDLLLVVLKRFLEHRRSREKPLKILLMSATIDPTLFQEYFRDPQGYLAPVIEVPGRSFPVTKYFLDDTIQDLKMNQVAHWVFEEPSVTKFLSREFGDEMDGDSERDDTLEIPYPLVALTVAHVVQKSDTGHVLVFLPGWEDINNVQRLLRNKSKPLGIDFNDSTRYSIHLLHSTIPLQDQQVIFEPPAPGVRRIILATNIAETSITIPDVVYVVDTAKIKENRYDPQRYMSYLVTAWVGSSNLNQRAGRAGRHRSGEYFGILSKARANLLSPYQMVEMKRADLSNVVMHIKALNFPSMGLHEVLAAAIEPPDPDRVMVAVRQLQQIGALDANETLTSLGKILLQLPIDVQLGRLLLYGAFFRCLDKVLALAAILQNRDPFLSPPLLRKEALAVKHSWSPPGVKSDVLSILSAYEAWAKLCSQGDLNQASRFCIENFLSKNTLQTIDRLKGHLLQALYNAGVIDVSAGGELANLAPNRTYIPPQLTTNSQSIPLLTGLVTFALQPKYAIQSSGKIFRTAKDKLTIVHPSSINSSKIHEIQDEAFQTRQILAFTEQRQTVTLNSVNTAPFLVGTSQTDSIHYMFFGAYHLEPTRQGLEGDGWVPIVGFPEVLESVRQVRILMDQCMLRVYEGVNYSARKQDSKEEVDESIFHSRKQSSRVELTTTEMQELDFLTRDIVRFLDKYHSEKAAFLPNKNRSNFLENLGSQRDNFTALPQSTYYRSELRKR